MSISPKMQKGEALSNNPQLQQTIFSILLDTVSN